MSILAIGKLPKKSEVSRRATEVMFDGRTIGELEVSEDNTGVIHFLADVNQSDVLNARKEIEEKQIDTTLEEYCTHLYLVAENKENHLKRMHKKLKKSTLYIVPGKKMQRIDQPYTERIRAHINKNHDNAVILNTLSDEEAFGLYFSDKEQ